MTGVIGMTDEEVRRLSWRCRRGLLELDIVLERFSEKYLAGLSNTELSAFDSLLDLQDNEFLDVVTLRISAADIGALKIRPFDANAMQAVVRKLSGH
jgi:antitoxin CptB